MSFSRLDRQDDSAGQPEPAAADPISPRDSRSGYGLLTEPAGRDGAGPPDPATQRRAKTGIPQPIVPEASLHGDDPRATSIHWSSRAALVAISAISLAAICLSVLGVAGSTSPHALSPTVAVTGERIAFLAGLFGLAAAVLSFLMKLDVDRARVEVERLRREQAETNAILDAVPVQIFRWRLLQVQPAGSMAAFEAFTQTLGSEDRSALQTAVIRLRAQGFSFTRTVRALDGARAWDVIGRRAVSSGQRMLMDMVLVFDQSDREHALGELNTDKHTILAARTLLDGVPVPVWRRGADLQIIDCNAAYGRAVDATVEQVLLAQHQLMAGVVGERGLALARAAQRAGKPQNATGHVVIEGSRRLLRFIETPFADGGLIGHVEDLTDVESVRAELARHIAAHGNVLEDVATAIAIYGPDARLKFFNAAFSALWRLDTAWLSGEPSLTEVLDRLREHRQLPEYADFRAFKQQQMAMFTSVIEPHEELLHLPDERTLRLRITPHPFGGLTLIYDDVTDTLAMERSYNTLIEVQRETLNHLYEGVAVFGSDGRLKLWNPAYMRIWQLSRTDLARQPHITQLIEKARDFFEGSHEWQATREELTSRVTGHAEASGVLERRDASILNYACVPLPDGNVLLSFLDVTDSSRVERALRERNEALETAGRLKTEFIANVSYELRTPLNAIIGFAEILSNRYFGELNARQLDYAKGIVESSQRLLSLINDILDLATIEAGYLALEIEPIDIHTVLASILNLVRERARKRNLTLDFDCAPDVGTILADERRIKQAILNLLSNSIKFTPPGGTIGLSACRDVGGIALTVSDTGIGVASQDRARVFEMFERGSSQARNAGAGLGLSLVKSLIELHGGRVTLTSAPNRGTTVTCHLPATQTKPEPDSEALPRPLAENASGPKGRTALH